MTRVLTTRLYVGSVIAAGVVLLIALAPREVRHPDLVAGLLAATLGLSLLKVRLPVTSGVATLSLAHTVDFVVLIVEGAGLAMLFGAVGVLLQCVLRERQRQPRYRAVFSAAAVVIAVQLAGWGWRALGGTVAELTLAATVLPLAACAITYYAVNTSLVVGAIATTAWVSPGRAWSPAFWWGAPAYLAGAAVAALAILTQRSC